MATNRRMERSTKEMHKFLAEHTTEDMTMDEINALLQEHLGEINAGIDRRRTEETAETADDFLDMAEDRLAEGNEQEALRRSCKVLRIDTNETNTPARSLYASLGYREVGAVPCEFNGIPNVNLVCLEKAVQA